MSPPPDLELLREQDRDAAEPWHAVRLTTRCSNRCMFCSEAEQAHEVTLTEAEACARLDEARERGASRLLLSGGEPTLHPAFGRIVAHGKRLGFTVNVVTNGVGFAEQGLFEKAAEAGLDRVTFSLHGDTARLHDRLTRTPGSYKRLVSAMRRAGRSGSVEVTASILVNRLNVGRLERIVDLARSTGARTIQLRRVEPFGRAFDHRDALLDDPKAYQDALQHVFRLARQSHVKLRTHAFPPGVMEGFEELMQAPAWMGHEVELRRSGFERYLETGRPLDCRSAERCASCALELYCTALDQLVADLHAERWQRWRLGSLRRRDLPPALPFGCNHTAVEVEHLDELSRLRHGPDLVVRVGSGDAERVDRDPLPGRRLVLVATSAAQAEAWLRSSGLPETASIEVELNQSTARWLGTNRRLLQANMARVRIVHPCSRDLERALASGVRQPRQLFQGLGLPLRVSGLPPCATPGARPEDPPRTLHAELFDTHTGTLRLETVTARLLDDALGVTTPRCRQCVLVDVCEGLHLNVARLEGLGITSPQSEIAWTRQVRSDLGNRARVRRPGEGAPPQPAAPRLDEAWRRFLATA